jgi:hypothetical protein
LLPNQSEKTNERKKQMKTNEFIAALRRAPSNQLMFVDLAGHAVHSGYHLTEIKAALFETVDCGGQINQWRETILQLWVPQDADDQSMTAKKFLKIFDKVSGMVPLDFDAEIRVEYGDKNFFPSIYRVRSVMHEQDETSVLLEPPTTTCKARDRRVASSTARFCCEPVTKLCCAT